MRTEKPEITVLMPCLNEEKTIGACIEKALAFLRESGRSGEVLIADNGSTDRSAAIAQGCGARVIRVEEKGYGSALCAGIEAAEGDYVIMGDADGSYDFLALQPFVDQLDAGADLVMGNRFLGGIEPGAMPFSHRYIGNPLLSAIGRVFYRTHVGDFHCGLRAFRRESIQKLGLCTAGMEFASEMVVKAVLFKLRIDEVPCKLYPDGRGRSSHLRSLPDGWRHLKFLLIYSPRWLFCYPGILLALLGFVTLTAIYIHPIRIGAVQFEVTTMFYAAVAFILGLQMLQFAMYTHIYARRIGQFPREGPAMKKLAAFVGGKGVLLALALMVAGFAGACVTLRLWADLGFGTVPDSGICKTAIMFGTLFLVGCQLLFSFFFTHVLGMGAGADRH